jgi:hypothetical protein
MGSAQILGSSIALGLSLFATTALLGWISIKYDWNANFLKWILLPVLGYGLALAMNSILQLTSCGLVKPSQIAIGSVPIIISIFLFLTLSHFSFIRSPIENIIPSSYKASYAGILAISFYMFWAGMFGEAVGSGVAQSCGK